MHRVIAIAGLVLGLASGSALACSIAPMTPSDVPTQGAECSMSATLTGYRAVSLSAVVDLGQGFLRQDIIDGHGCEWEQNLLIQDCAANRQLVVGWEDNDLMDPGETSLGRITARIDEAARGGTPLTLEAIADLARAEGLPTQLETAGGQRLSVNGYTVGTSCACSTYYP